MNIFLTEIGYFGPYIIAGIIAYNLYIDCSKNIDNNPKLNLSSLTLLFIGCGAVNEISNRFLKHLIKQPRPKGIDYINYWDSFDSQETEELTPTEKNPKISYGMPSGHAQNISTGAIFLILYKKNIYLTVYAVLQIGITLYQRYVYKKHTFEQLCAGTIIGIITGIIYYKLFMLYKS